MRTNARTGRWRLALLALACLAALMAEQALAQPTYERVKSIGSPALFEAYPYAGVVVGPDGSLYGTTAEGGSADYGTVFKLNPDGSGYQVLHSFTGIGGDGALPYGGLVVGLDGSLYGTTYSGGSLDDGTVFKLDPATSAYSVIHNFDGVGGALPYAGLVVGSGGVLYGTTEEGGSAGLGTVFKLNPDGTGFQVLHSFGATAGDGANPTATLLIGTGGILYGTTEAGGSSGDGTVFRLNPADTTYSVLHSFDSASYGGVVPYGALAIGPDGALYGTTYFGGDWGGGTVFRLNPADSTYSLAHSFGELNTDGARPYAGLLLGADGALYGTTEEGGTADHGTVFRLNPADNTFSVVHNFSNAGGDGSHPEGRLTQGPGGVIYGTTVDGGDSGSGTVFRVVVPGVSSTPVISSSVPTAASANGAGFTLAVYGDFFLPGATVNWNGVVRPTTFVSSTELQAAIPASDLVTIEPLTTVSITVQNPNGESSPAVAFSIVAQSVAALQSSVVPPGGVASVSTAPVTAGSPGVTATLTNIGGGAAIVTAATYSDNPWGETRFFVGSGQFVDLQIVGADNQDSAQAVFYYPPTVTGLFEAILNLCYYDGSQWVSVRSSGDTQPLKDTTDIPSPPASPVSGGRFTVVFDNTSRPKITELNGTVFGLFDSTPQIEAVTGPVDPVPLGTAVTLAVSFATVGEATTPSITFAWEDGTESVVAPSAEGLASASHVYAVPGVYPVTVRVTDEDGDVAASRYDYVVVYDPTAGFVTGGGWIMSPPGAYTLDPTLTGKAKFGFESKYKRGATVPSGETEFEFSAGEFHFHSKTYQWLVLLGARAQFKGTGYIEGGPLCGFLLTATDGQLPLGGGTDKFRIRIWEQATGVMLYDNRLGAPEDINNADPQALGGGSITIKKAK